METPGRKWQGTADDYRYGTGGKEKASEINSGDYDFGARMLDTRIGRWISRDPKYYKYPFFSPYVAFGDNPNIFIDPGGETLKVSTTDPVLLSEFRTAVNGAFDGKVEAQINEGVVTFHLLKDKVLSEYEKAALKELNDATSSKYTANITLVSNDKATRTDEFYSGRLDIADLVCEGNDENLLSSKGMLVHFAVEQIQKSFFEESENKKITSENDGERWYYTVCHKAGVNAERKTTNLQRAYKGKDDHSDANGSYQTNESTLKTKDGEIPVIFKSQYDRNWNNPKMSIEYNLGPLPENKSSSNKNGTQTGAKPKGGGTSKPKQTSWPHGGGSDVHHK